MVLEDENLGHRMLQEEFARASEDYIRTTVKERKTGIFSETS